MCANLVDLKKCCTMSIQLQKSALIQPRTSSFHGICQRGTRTGVAAVINRQAREQCLGDAPTYSLFSSSGPCAARFELCDSRLGRARSFVRGRPSSSCTESLGACIRVPGPLTPFSPLRSVRNFMSQLDKIRSVPNFILLSN